MWTLLWVPLGAGIPTEPPGLVGGCGPSGIDLAPTHRARVRTVQIGKPVESSKITIEILKILLALQKRTSVFHDIIDDASYDGHVRKCV